MPPIHATACEEFTREQELNRLDGFVMPRSDVPSDGAVAANATILERLTGPYTALPTVIFSWARQPRAEFRELTAAAIIVLLVLVLIINAIAIVLRNQYARK